NALKKPVHVDLPTRSDVNPAIRHRWDVKVAGKTSIVRPAIRLSWAETMPANTLDYITIQGFKSIKSIEKLKFSPINILIGPNGSGKSNFVGAFSFLHAVREGKLRDYVTRGGGAEKILHFGSKNTREIHFHVSFNDAVNEYGLKLAPTSDD